MSVAHTPSEPFDINESSTRSVQQPTPVLNLPCEEVEDLIPAYAIGALDPEEMAAVNARLAACPVATAELATYSKLADRLLYTAPPQQAPVYLITRLVAIIASPAASLSDSPEPIAPPALGPLPLPLWPAAPLPAAPKSRQRWFFRHKLGNLATVASLLLVILNLAFLVQNQQLRNHTAQLGVELDQQTKALIFLAAEEPLEIMLYSSQENNDAQADVLWNSSLGIAVVYVRDFPELPADRAYQIWLNKGDQRSSPGLFRVKTGGMGIFVFSMDQTLDFYDTIDITPEPASGSPAPTAPAIVQGPTTIVAVPHE